MKLYIVNRVDRPDARHVARERGGKLYYVHPDLRNVKTYHGMSMQDATPLEDFGVLYAVRNGKITAEQLTFSGATYSDGKPRQWQGEKFFTIEGLDP